MKIFKCGHCNQPIFFENFACESCGHLTGYRDSNRKMLTFAPNAKRLIADRDQKEYKYCKNIEFNACNWVMKKNSPEDYCNACLLNRTIPNLADENNFEKWQKLEVAKHRLIYQLQKIGLPIPTKMRNPNGLCFDFVAQQNNPSLMTGHADGVITILLREADSTLREKMRKQFLEPYRTLIGHLRHEVGHYFWDQLVYKNPDTLATFRDIFGDERINYDEALKLYYKIGAPSKWEASFISKYATSHAWEDWAETWAHYLHIMDMVETAYFFGITVKPIKKNKELKVKASFDPYNEKDFNVIIKTCRPLSVAINSINRAMGSSDLYPFVITTPVVDKLKFIHQMLLNKRS